MPAIDEDATTPMVGVLLLCLVLSLAVSVAGLLGADGRMVGTLLGVWGLAVATFCVMAFRKARAEGTGFWRSVGRAFRRLGRLAWDGLWL